VEGFKPRQVVEQPLQFSVITRKPPEDTIDTAERGEDGFGYRVHKPQPTPMT
jgi:hypothetical protein